MKDFSKSCIQMNFQVYKMAKWGEGDPRWIGVIFFHFFKF